MANIVGLVGIGVSGVALIFAIVALASDNWETIETKSVLGTSDIKIGLWKICTNIKVHGMEEETCHDLKDVDLVNIATCGQKISAGECKVMIFLAIITTTGAIVSAVLVMFVMKEQQILLFAAGGLNLASGIFLMTAFAIYFHEIKTDDSDGVSSDLGYGFALDILAWLAAWAAGGLFIAAKFLTKD